MPFRTEDTGRRKRAEHKSALNRLTRRGLEASPGGEVKDSAIQNVVHRLA